MGRLAAEPQTDIRYMYIGYAVMRSCNGAAALCARRWWDYSSRERKVQTLEGRASHMASFSWVADARNFSFGLT